MKLRSKSVLNVLVAAGVIASSAGYAAANEAKPKTASPAATEKVLRFNLDSEPPTVDPGLAEDELSLMLTRALYDGLVRLGPDGKLQPSMAHKIDVSDDLKTYTFHLRDAKWSNGDPVTAHDFEYAWKRVLDPKTASNYAYQLYPIKNAEKANIGEEKLDAVGVKAVDAKTLRVELEKPTPYFVQLTAFPTFYPVNKKVDAANAKWAYEASTHVGNGPYKLASWEHKEQMTLVKNASYWDQAAVKLDKIDFSMIEDEVTELAMFDTGELDWAGAPGPLPLDALPGLKAKGILHTKPIAAVYWYKFNTEQAPFSNAKIRKAFAYALNRQAIVDTVTRGNQVPATAVVPVTNGERQSSYFKDNDRETAKKLLAEGMKELGISKLPPISLLMNRSEAHRNIALEIQKQWKETLGAEVKLVEEEWKVFLEDMYNGNYQIGRMGWFADYADPSNFLQLFYEKKGGNNNTNWENKTYQSLLDQAAQQADPVKRKQLLAEAEAILMEEMPVIPLYYYANNWVQDEKLKGIVIDELGYIDFKWATKE
ncbi:peptide ABC transporter substrate-binding protein [Brevibacillus gelatini]|uniref:Peptide ABC transporter substrate-binding protein n=1 Tax=Brevibacillus gelatini TaxID=1655277 RepID=A0A3M8BDY3_9BACL|nr:peptide ABC transporter substrate-binding protein [Brevibacillus gelatini]RNB61105.1 peptide ABC transporter substrate-binding protein [Brevibacillus gelatini]